MKVPSTVLFCLRHPPQQPELKPASHNTLQDIYYTFSLRITRIFFSFLTTDYTDYTDDYIFLFDQIIIEFHGFLSDVRHKGNVNHKTCNPSNLCNLWYIKLLLDLHHKVVCIAGSGQLDGDGLCFLVEGETQPLLGCKGVDGLGFGLCPGDG